MTKLQQAIDVRALKPADPDGVNSFLPVGLHPGMFTAEEIKANSDPSSGHHLALTFTCKQGPAVNMTGIYRLNLFHTKSQKASQIAYEQLAAIGHVVGVFSIEDTSQLLNKPLQVVVESQNDPQYPQSTHIRGVTDLNGDKPGQPGVKAKVPEAAAINAQPTGGAPQGAWAPAGAAPAPAAGQPAWGPASAPAQAPAQAAAAPAAPAVSGVAAWPGAAAAPGATGAGASPTPAWAVKA